jgi:hypothetical protein
VSLTQWLRSRLVPSCQRIGKGQPLTRRRIGAATAARLGFVESRGVRRGRRPVRPRHGPPNEAEELLILHKNRPPLRLLGSLTLIAAISVYVGCGSPAQPTQEERIPLFSGQWRGVIGEVEAVLQIQAQRGFGSPALSGTGTFLNRTTGQNGRLTISGLGTLYDTPDRGPALLNLATPDEVGADGRITKPQQHMGQFRGHLSGSRTWPGQFEGPYNNSGMLTADGIFGVQRAAVTFIKD